MNSQASTAVEFTGNGKEYFGIWIVNLLLSLVTLGIYSAWAKVRRKKYFYQNTLVDKVGFDYHANPASILKGRAIAFVLFLAVAFSEYIHPFLSNLLLILLFIALPWLVVRASIFNARNSSHRGLRFDFDGTVGKAFKYYFLYPILVVFTLGLAAPYVMRLQNKFSIDHHKFGTTHFDLQATNGEYYSIYLKFFGAMVLLGLLGSAIFYGLASKLAPTALPAAPFVSKLTDQAPQPIHLAEAEPQGNQEALKKYQQAVEKALKDANGDPAKATEALQKAQAEFQKSMQFANPGAVTADSENQPEMAGSDTEADSSQADSPEEALQKLQEELAKADGSADGADSGDSEEKKAAEAMAKMMALGPLLLIPVLLYLIVIFGIIAYFQVRLGNLIWNTTKLDKLSFKSSMRVRDLLWIHVSNFLLLLSTLGLATPWAKVRTTKYLASKLAVKGVEDINQFVGDKKAEAKATGEEIAEMFDMDLGFG